MVEAMLDPVEHSRIIADEQQVCTTAGVQARFLRSSMTGFCGPDEVEWVKKFWQHHAEGMPGLVLEGISRPDTRCQAIAGALVRNFIDARVIPLNTILNMASDGGVPSPSVLLIPNLFMSAMGKNVPAWRIQILYDLLLERSTQGKESVVYVEDLKSLVHVYGVPFRDFLEGFRLIHD